MPKQKFKIGLAESVQKADLFREPVFLNVEGETMLKTTIGGLLTLAIVLFLLVQVVIQTVSIINREKPAVVQTSEIQDDPLVISLDRSNNFAFALSISRDNINVNMTNNSPLSFTSTYIHQTRSKEGVLTKRTYSIIWAPCVQANFPTNVFPGSTFSSYALQYAVCPKTINFTDSRTGICPDEVKARYADCLTPFEFSLQGNYLSFDFKYLQTRLHYCDSKDSNTISGLRCTNETSDAVFNSSQIKVNLYYTNIIVSPENYGAPNRSYIDTTYWSVNPKVLKLTDLYLDSLTVQDFNHLTNNNVYANRSFYSINTNNIKEMQVFNADNMLEINLRRSNVNSLTIRKYSKFLDVVSNIGGVANVLLLIGAFLTVGYSEYKHQMLLSNRLYDFSTENLKPKKLKSVRVSPEIDEKVRNQFNNSSATLLKISARDKETNEKDHFVNNYFASKTKEKNFLPYNEFTYLKTLFNKIFRRQNETEKIAAKAREQVIRDLDIVKIVEKLKEIDKLKSILLNSHQREAFNFIEKPIVTLRGTRMNRRSAHFLKTLDASPKHARDYQVFDAREEYDSLSKYSRLYNAYTFLKEDTESRNLKCNKKILSLIGDELIEVFKRVDEYLRENPGPKRFEEAVREIINKGAKNATPEESDRIRMSVTREVV